MIILGMWGRNFNAAGQMACFPANAWKWYAQHIDLMAPWFDGFQCPPAALTASGSAADGDGYGVQCYRILDGTYWGDKADLVAFRLVTKQRGKQLWGDFPWREMDGELPGEPGVFELHGTGKFAGKTTPSWFQYFGQAGEKLPPKGTAAEELVNYFVPQDSIPSTDGDEPDGRVQSMQHCIPTGIVVENIIDALQGWQDDIGYDGGRIDEGKALYLHALAEIVASQPDMDLYAEVMFGNVHDLWQWACTAPMNSRVAVEDYAWYWHLQTACNTYNFRALAADGFYGFFEYFSSLSILFFGNPDVTSSRGVDGSISEQIAFNLGLAAAVTIPLPAKAVIIDAQGYWPASSTFPDCFGFQDLWNNICSFARMFAFGAWVVRWLDEDIFAYTRDGNGGEYGWSGGCLIVANINTYTTRYPDLQTMWPEGTWVHNYSATGQGEDYTVGPGGVLYSFEAKNNAYSNGRSYYLIAQEEFPKMPDSQNRHHHHHESQAREIVIADYRKNHDATPMARESGEAWEILVGTEIISKQAPTESAAWESALGKLQELNAWLLWQKAGEPANEALENWLDAEGNLENEVDEPAPAPTPTPSEFAVHVVKQRKLGRREVKVDPRTLRLEKYTTALPAPPQSVLYGGNRESWGEMLNDTLGDCIVAALGHAIQVWTAAEGNEVTVADSTILQKYEHWFGYNPSDPGTDQGGIILDGLKAFKKHNIDGHVLDAFASVNCASIKEVCQAIDLFGGVDIGFDVPGYLMAGNAPPTVWDVNRLADNSILGGHSVFVRGYTTDQFGAVTFDLISWGENYQMTQAFWLQFVDESYALLSSDFLKNNESASGFDLAQLQADLTAL